MKWINLHSEDIAQDHRWLCGKQIQDKKANIGKLHIHCKELKCIYQSSAYEAVNRTCTPLHTPKTLEMC